MKKVVTLQHIYGKNRDRMAELLKSLVENELKDLKVKVEVSITPENWAEFSLEGEDDIVSANLLTSRYGSPATLCALKPRNSKHWAAESQNSLHRDSAWSLTCRLKLRYLRETKKQKPASQKNSLTSGGAGKKQVLTGLSLMVDPELWQQ